MQELRKNSTVEIHTSTTQHKGSLHTKKTFKTASIFFIQNNTVKRSLTSRYQGPFIVISRADKYIRIKCGNITDIIAIDRTQPVSLEMMSPKTHLRHQAHNHNQTHPPLDKSNQGGKSLFRSILKHIYIRNWYDQFSREKALVVYCWHSHIFQKQP